MENCEGGEGGGGARRRRLTGAHSPRSPVRTSRPPTTRALRQASYCSVASQLTAAAAPRTWCSCAGGGGWAAQEGGGGGRALPPASAGMPRACQHHLMPERNQQLGSHPGKHHRPTSNYRPNSPWHVCTLPCSLALSKNSALAPGRRPERCRHLHRPIAPGPQLLSPSSIQEQARSLPTAPIGLLEGPVAVLPS